jgi:RecA/RadA recombinase
MANLNSFLKKLKEETGGESFAESRFGDVSNWISTGSYALNRILSGSIYKGIPSGRVIILGGESSSGKSLISAYIAANALKQGYDAVFYFDSEGGGLKEFFEGVGCDTEKIIQILVESVEDAQIQILKTFKMIQDYKESDPNCKFLCVLDSLGALVAEKVLRDADKDKVASEMGGRSKIVNNMVKAITIPALKTDTAMLILNHIYDDPSAMFASKIKNQGGGRGLQYMGTINVQCSRLLEKETDKEGDAFHSGTNLNFFTVKNRICRPSLETRIYLDFKKGFTNKFDGLFEEALRYGFIQCPSQGYFTVPSWSDPEKKWRRAQLESNTEVWNTFIDEFDKKSMQDLKYSKAAMDAIEEQNAAEEADSSEE